MAKFEIFKGSDNQFYFRLKAGNGENILGSEGYTQKPSCENGIESVRKHSPYDSYYERRIASNMQYYFVLKASNGQVIGKSQMYASSQGRDGGIDAVKRDAPTAPIVDLTK
jgi:uncharacterized protein